MVATSLGGREVLEQVLAPLPADFPAPVLVVQHVGDRGPSHLPELLAQRARRHAQHAVAGERPRPGVVYVASPGRHLEIDAAGRCALRDGDRVNFARPAADVLFRSAAAAFGARTLGVVLTGRLHDGAAGAEAIRQAGGVVLVQEPASCRAPDMPLAVIRRGAAHLALPPAALGPALAALVAGRGTPALAELDARAA